MVGLSKLWWVPSRARGARLAVVVDYARLTLANEVEDETTIILEQLIAIQRVTPSSRTNIGGKRGEGHCTIVREPHHAASCTETIACFR